MIVKKYSLLIVFAIFLMINSQEGMNESQIMELFYLYRNTCLPTPDGITYSAYLNQDCRHLEKYPTNESEFYCCEVEFYEKKNESDHRKGCLAVLTNYIDNDRYEDWIDYIQRGKLEQIQQYSIFLGRNASARWTNFVKNRTKYKVLKFDCYSKYVISKNYFVLFLTVLLFGLI